MGILNFIMGIVAVILVTTGLKKEEATNPEDKKYKVEIIKNERIIERTLDFNELIKRAEKLLKVPYEEPKKISPKSLSELDYNRYKDIRFIPDKSVWRKEGSPFQLQFLHSGHLYNHGIGVNELIDNKYNKILYDKSMFDFSSIPVKEKIPNALEFSGFKIHYPINTEEHTDEFAVFQGATYFRAVSESQYYGLSARGIAINTLMNYPEDFPIFKEFWIKKPDKNDKSITVYALMDGKSATGAFQFEFTPGKKTSTQVKAVIYLRKQVDRFGIAPLTSMYWYGENSEGSQPGIYPEVHDSDGLLTLTKEEEWIWRPIENPKKSTIDVFPSENIKGFGLLQRDRDFSSYEDSEMKYHLRPSAWIEPSGDWGKGSVQMYRNPTNKDSDDNIGAFWVPEKTPEVGKPFEVEYTIFWLNEVVENKKVSNVIATRIKQVPEPFTKFIQIDFKGESLDLIKTPEEIEHMIHTSDNAIISEAQLNKIEESNKWRLGFKIKGNNTGKPIELKAYLKDKNKALTETWTDTVEF